MTVGELLARMSSAEITEWQAYYGLNPFGLDRSDWRAAQVCAVVANVNRDRRRRPQPFSPADFMPRFARAEPEVIALADLEAQASLIDRTLFPTTGDSA